MVDPVAIHRRMSIAKRRRYALALAAVLILPTSCHAPRDAADSGSASGDAAPARALRAALVENAALEQSLAANGVLAPIETISITSDFPGVPVRQVLVDAGQVAHAGEVLIRLDDSMLRAQIAQQQAAVRQQSIQLAQARQESHRAAKLKGQMVIADEAIAARDFRAQGADAALGIQQASLAQLRIRAGRMVLASPVSGVVIERNVSIGDLTGSTPRPMLVVVPFGQMALKVQVPEAQLGQLLPGTPATVTLADGRVFNGHVRQAGAQVAAQSAQADIWIAIGSPLTVSTQPLRPGMSGVAKFSLGASQRLAVPEAAVLYDSSGASVMTITADGRAHRMSVRTGARTGGKVELLSGPPAGTTVALGGGSFVSEGDRVKPVYAQARAPL